MFKSILCLVISIFPVPTWQAFKTLRKIRGFWNHQRRGKRNFFAVWAPNAQSVQVIGNFNFWDKESHALFPRWDSSGIWEGFIPHIHTGETYKFGIQTKSGEYLEKLDPFGLYCETPPKPLASFGIPIKNGMTRLGWKIGPLTIAYSRPCPYMKFTLGLGKKH